MKVNTLVALASGLLFSAATMAGTCELGFTRTACPGKEALSFKKCDGKASCSDFQEAADAGQCKTLAIAACENSRTTITKLKVITAKLDGVELKTDAGSTDFCTAYPKAKEEFNQC